MSEQIPKTQLPAMDNRSESVDIVLHGLENGVVSPEEVLLEANKTFFKHAVGLEEVNEALKEKARYDEMTGLLNRDGMVQEIEKILELPEEERENIHILFVDLDNFKSINDTKGHAKGDTILRAVADRFKVRKSDTAGRFGGDEFVVILDTEAEEQDRRDQERSDGKSRREENISPEDMALAAMERLREEIEEVGRENGEVLSASIGAVRVNGHTSVPEILDLSDEAMYMDKSSKQLRIERLEKLRNGETDEVIEDEIRELEEIHSDIEMDKLMHTSLRDFSENGVVFAGKHWNTLRLLSNGLENFLFNIGSALNGDESLKNKSFIQAGVDEAKLNEIFVNDYPAMATRVKTLAKERVNNENELRAGRISGEEYLVRRDASVDETELLTTYVFLKLSKSLGSDSEIIDLLKE